MRRIPIFFGLAAVLLPMPLWAQDNLATSLRACAAIPDAADRLSCYDRVSGRAALAAPQPMPQRPPPSAISNPVADFGADSLPEAPPAPPPRSPLQSITAQVTDFGFDTRGHFIVTLANGQIWREIEGDTVNVPLRKDRTHLATVSRAILGSYSIRFDDPRGLFKVIRVR